MLDFFEFGLTLKVQKCCVQKCWSKNAGPKMLTSRPGLEVGEVGEVGIWNATTRTQPEVAYFLLLDNPPSFTKLAGAITLSSSKPPQWDFVASS